MKMASGENQEGIVATDDVEQWTGNAYIQLEDVCGPNGTT